MEITLNTQAEVRPFKQTSDVDASMQYNMSKPFTEEQLRAQRREAVAISRQGLVENNTEWHAKVLRAAFATSFNFANAYTTFEDPATSVAERGGHNVTTGW